METKYKEYKHEESFERLDEILDASDTSFPEVDEIPSRDKLTYKNGYYVNCSALFVDIRDSSELPNKHKRPTLAKIYRSYISEVVAIMNGNINCSEIRIEGDCVSGIYNTPKKWQIDSMFSDSAKINSLIKVLNHKFKKRNITEIEVGIGMDYGRALMIKSGYKGSGLNEIVWMGDVVNGASNLCGKANKGWENKVIFASNVIYSNLNEHNKKLLEKNYSHDCYHGNFVNTEMEKWYDENCKASATGFGGLF
ncbi:adenylate/guanylate cyclase domain-containing protein [Pseudoalteromonas sp. SS15]|uniref:adenylate/guanylate cyclase domain-containing protein n=1 Tax=Pseudoalteromonas sp. SS15 TaxID=3139393 RepID=UPI003BAAC2C8